MPYTAHEDTFARDHLPPAGQWPDLINLDKLNYPEKLNCAVELLDKAVVAGDGERVCLRSPGQVWTYADLQTQANKIAHVLKEAMKLRPGERVLLRSANNPFMVACWFAIVKAGGIVVATMPLLRAKELSVIAEKAQVRLGLCDQRLKDEMVATQQNVLALQQVLYFDELQQKMSDQPAEFDTIETASDDVCLIAFTSGTTGKPKGTMHFHRDVLTICEAFSRRVLKPQPDDIFIGSPPLAFTFGLGGLVLFPMHARASTILLEAAPPDKLAEAIAEYQATTVFTAPTAYRALLNSEYNLSSLRYCISAGETLPLPTYNAWYEKTGIRIIDGLGSTELLHIFITSADDDIRPGATGKPIPYYEAKIVNQEGQDLPPESVGLLAVRGPTGCRYLDDDRQTDYVVNGWNLTGDAYKMDQAGYFWFQARADDMIISAGYNIAGPEVEDVLLAHEAVAECAVVAAPDEQRGQIVKAYVVLQAGADTLTNAELVKTLQDFVKAQIAPYKYPRAIEFVTQLPRTETGKVQRFKLRQQAFEQTSQQA